MENHDKKIGVVANSSWNLFNFRRELLAHLQNKGYQIVAIAPDDGYGQRLEALGFPFESADFQPKSSSPLQELALLLRLRELYRKHRFFAVLHFTIKPNLYGTLAAQSLGIPAINNVTGLGTVFLHHDLKSRIAKALYRWAFRFPKKVFFQNEDDRSLFLSQKLVRVARTALLPGSGVDLARFRPSSFRRNRPMVFLMVARLLYDKGVVEFVESAKILKSKGLDVVFKILGGIEPAAGLGVSAEMLRGWVSEGWVEHHDKVEDVRPFLEEADCVVLPSYREGTPRSLLEAAAMGKPLIATDVPGCREVVHDGNNGFLCRVKNASDLADKILKMSLLEDSTLRTLGENSRRLAVAQFDQQKVFLEYEKALGECGV